MNFQNKVLLICLLLFSVSTKTIVMARVRDLCLVKPTTTGLCVPTTLGIYYDPETQHCRYMGCNQKKLFATLADCEKICNNTRHRRRRIQTHSSRPNETNN